MIAGYRPTHHSIYTDRFFLYADELEHAIPTTYAQYLTTT